MEILGKYRLDEIYNENSYQAIKGIPDGSIDLIVTDPPYVYGDYSKGNEGFDETDDNIEFIKNISEGFEVEKTFHEFKRVLKKMNMFVFCSKLQVAEIMNWGTSNNYQTNILIWKKGGRPFGVTYLHDIEFIIHIRETGSPFNGMYKSRVFEALSVRQFDHPTEKPAKVVNKLIQYGSNKGDLVADFFSGSGTTCACAKEMGRRFIGFENDPKHFKISVDRLNGITKDGQTSIFTDFSKVIGNETILERSNHENL